MVYNIKLSQFKRILGNWQRLISSRRGYQKDGPRWGYDTRVHFHHEYSCLPHRLMKESDGWALGLSCRPGFGPLTPTLWNDLFRSFPTSLMCSLCSHYSTIFHWRKLVLCFLFLSSNYSSEKRNKRAVGRSEFKLLIPWGGASRKPYLFLICWHLKYQSKPSHSRGITRCPTHISTWVLPRTP